MALREPPLGVNIGNNSGFTTLSWVEWFSELFANGTTGRPLLESITVSDSPTSVEVTQEINATKLRYEILLSNIKVSSNGANIQLLASTDGGTTYLEDYDFFTYKVQSSTSLSTSSGTGEGVVGLESSGLSSSEFKECNGTITIEQPADTETHKQVYWDLYYFDTVGNKTIERGYGTINTISALNAFKIQISNGVLKSGTVAFYGIK